MLDSITNEWAVAYWSLGRNDQDKAALALCNEFGVSPSEVGDAIDDTSACLLGDDNEPSPKAKANSAVKLSRTSKLGTFSWSLQALETCPGSIGDNGALVAACAGCYATTGNYNYPNVKAPRAFNKDDWKRDEWVHDMVAALQNERYFRWFDSGDMYHIELARKIWAVMLLTPWCHHWLPTRMAKFDKFRSVIERMQALPNVMVRFSADSVDGAFTAGVHGSVIIPDADNAPDGVFVCGAYANDGKCGSCRACYDKNVSVIAYPAHGKKMAKVIRILSHKD